MKSVTFKKVKKFKIYGKKVLTESAVFDIISEHAREGREKKKEI